LIYKRKYAALLALQALMLLCFHIAKASNPVVTYASLRSTLVTAVDTPPPPVPATNNLPYPFDDESYGVPMYNPDGGLRLSTPPNIKTDVEYNPQTGKYDVYQKMGNLDYRIPTEMDSDQYEDYMFNQSEKNYFKQKNSQQALTKQQQKGLIPPIHIGGKAFAMIFGTNTVNIRPQGSAELTFGFNNSKLENPALPVVQRSLTTFNFDENIQLNVVGEIGDKLKLTTNYNTKATFDFQNQMKLQYSGHEDDIIKSIDAGNITFPLPGTLITGSQSLFGLKTKLQFGRLTATLVYAQEKGEKKTITVQNGSQTSNFNIKVDQYQANQNYFLSQYFRQIYDSALAHPPIINSSLVVTKIEVWVTNTSTATQNTRDILAFADMGENSTYFTEKTGGPVSMNFGFNANSVPADTINSLDPFMQIKRNSNIQNPLSALSVLQGEGFQQVTDFEKIDLARMLAPTEYTLNPKLGYISLKQPLNYDQVLAVAYQYSYQGKTYQVGQFSTDGVLTTNELMVKMLKSTNVSPKVPLWQLMMKNIYALGSFQINPQNFILNLWYNNPATGVDIPYLPSGSLSDKELLGVMGLDQVDQQGDRVQDGLFDFLPGVTIDPANGLVIFPSVQPFGSYLRTKLTKAGYSTTAAAQFVFQQLYDSVLVLAQAQPTLDRYWIRGSFQSSASSDISLNAMNIPPGSVIVTAGGIKLTENVDYTVDYTLGRVKILNQGLLSSGTPIQISLENNALFSIESKTYAGAHFDYLVNKDFTLGATIVNYTEHPLTQIVSIGQEPVSNTMIGLNEDFKQNAPWLTRWIDALPFISTKAPSEITANTEVAAMIPGHPKYIGSTGTAYIDDFEGSESFIDISQPFTWSLASTPQGQPSEFPEAALNDSLPYGFNRAKVGWFVVDPLFQQQQSGVTPSNINAAAMSNNFYRMVLQTEIFPQEQSATGTPINLPVLNFEFYPNIKGPYNYDVLPTAVSKGIDDSNHLVDPQSRWGGIQRPLQETDFETDNINYIEFWMMNPYNSDNGSPNNTGTLCFDLGDVSEDVLKDGVKSFENGLPTDAADMVNPNNVNNPYLTTVWGRMPVNPSLVNAFNNTDASRPYQDIGLDGLIDSSEQTYFRPYLNKIAAKFGTGSVAYTTALNDPSSDDYRYYRDDRWDAASASIQQRYMMYNGLEGNSQTSSQYSNENPNGGNYPTTQSTLPNTEDINQDNTLSQDEAYYEYQVAMDPRDVSAANVGNNYITNAFQTSVKTPDGNTKSIIWYQFKIPISSFIRKVGNISDFKSIRFIRMYLKGCDKPVRLRFGQLELVRDDWRQFTGSLLGPGDYVTGDNLTTFDMYGVNLQENSGRTPVNYVIPPGISRQLNLQSANLVQQNEASLAIHVCDLQDGDARAVYKNVQIDMRAYKNLQMFIHCESADPAHPLNQGDVQGFIRIGSDFVNNYYEYAVPLQVTKPGSYNTNNATDQATVWPTNNQMNISLSTLENAKVQRDVAMLTNPAVTLQLPYEVKDGSNIITVVGNPTVSNAQVLMLGVRNPKRTPATAESDDGKPKCTEVWFDELRMTDFSESGGYAAISRITAKLADLGTLSLSGNLMTPGFGSLETKVGSLSRETDYGFDLAANLEMGKFLPQKWNVSVPTYIGYSTQIARPEYNPLDPDILMSDALKGLNKQQQDSLKALTLTTTTRKSFNFTNVHKNKGKNAKKSHIYDVENFSATYGYSEKDHTDVNTVFNQNKSYKGALTYNYAFHPKNIQPLMKSQFFKKRKYLALVGDFNFFPLPDRFTANTTIDREYNAFQLRNTVPGTTDITLPIAVSRTFDNVRTYTLSFPLAKSLRFDYTATNDARVMEPEGIPVTTRQQKDSVARDLFTSQQNMDFKQSITASYDIPVNKLPYLDFVTASAHYTANYEWQHAPLAADSLGATIQNSNTKSINGQLNLQMLYGKVPFFKKMLESDKKKAGPGNRIAPNIGKGGGGPQSPKPSDNENPDTVKHSPFYYVGKYFTYLVTSVKNITFNYSDNAGTLLPGFNYSSNILGMYNPPANDAPGLPFVFGGQNGFLNQVEKNNWLVPISSIYTPYTTVHAQTLTLHATIEPIPDWKIEVSANRTYSMNTSQYVHDSAGRYVSNTYTEMGNFSMSYFALRTAFTGLFSSATTSPLFGNYLWYRSIISYRLAAQNPNSAGITGAYADGYSGISQNVVIPAFLAAYSGQNPNKITLNLYPQIPMPNWNMSYSGLSKLKWIKKHFQSVVISNAYSSAYTVGGFNYNLLFGTDAEGFPNVRDVNGDFLPRDQIPTVSISDQFSPLGKIAITFKNNVTSNIEVRTDRQIALNMSDLTVNEVHGTEYLVGAGYKIKNVTLPFKIGGKAIKNDMTIRADFSLRQNETIIRNTLDGSNQVTGGQGILSIKSQIEYMVNTRITIRLYFDKIINTPYISSSYPTSTMDGGLALRFSLS
jgi:cell surface protein SprA